MGRGILWIGNLTGLGGNMPLWTGTRRRRLLAQVSELHLGNAQMPHFQNEKFKLSISNRFIDGGEFAAYFQDQPSQRVAFSPDFTEYFRGDVQNSADIMD